MYGFGVGTHGELGTEKGFIKVISFVCLFEDEDEKKELTILLLSVFSQGTETWRVLQARR